MKQILFLAVFIGIMMFSMTATFAAPTGEGKSILYIPIDNRPVNLKQTVEVAEKLGYEIIVPPEEFLGTGANEDQLGDPDELWIWLNDNAVDADIAVISTDAMLYGSLVASRKHDLSVDVINTRAEKFKQFKKDFPYLKIYALGTIMRTPQYNATEATEPEYQRVYGLRMFNYSALKDKVELGIATRNDINQIENLEKEIPIAARENWFLRRAKNYSANKYFVDLMRDGIFDYFLLGCDDSAMFSQTHLESRHLTDYGSALGKTRFQVMSGADELGMLMISRAINNDLDEVPFVSVEYNIGKGKDTFPRYGNETIGESIEAAIISIGGMRVPDPSNADLSLIVNTFPNGKTVEAASNKNKKHPHSGIGSVMKTLSDSLDKGCNVGLVDIAYSNGADNALMEQLRKKNLQFSLTAYGGWNTATNTSGFLIGSGVLTKFMSERDKNYLLMTRYLDDWIYQANIRQKINNGLIWTVPGNGNANNLKEKRPGIENLMTELMTKFAYENIKFPSGYYLKNFNVTSPWSRMFEANFNFDF